MLDLAIIGSGPYGISLAAHAKEAGMDFELFGYPMDFWQNKMPPEMFIRTKLDFLGLSDPHDRFTLEAYQQEKGCKLEFPAPRSVWVDYAFWFAKKNNISFTKEWVTDLRKSEQGFSFQTETGRFFRARSVVVAIGLIHAEYIPDNLAHIPREWVSHTSGYTQFGSFRGKRVIVLGGGQSAWEAAALLHQSGANVELVYRGSSRIPPIPNINARQRELSDKFYFLPADEQEALRKELLQATVTDFLVSLVEGIVSQRPNTQIVQAHPTSTGKLAVTYHHGEIVEVDHVIAATGYRVSLDNIPFLKSIAPRIDIESNGFPKVNAHFQSSVNGLYFVGPLSSYHHGPTYTQIAGVWHAARTVMSSIKIRKSFIRSMNRE
jgi:lysine/ornithine N-monooxygenase